MTASLIAAGLYELVGAVINPEYRVQAGGLGLGDGEPDTATLASILLDGDVQSGDRTKNRHVTLKVKVIGSTRLDLTTKVDLLRSAVNSKTWTLTYTPDGGLPIIFDCYRATTTHERPQYVDALLETIIDVSFDALPFGRSPDQQSITVAARMQIDSFDTAPTTGATLDTTTKIEGTGSAKVVGNRTTDLFPSQVFFAPAASITRTFAAKNLSAYPTVTVQALALPATSTKANLTTTVTLASASGSTTYPGVGVSFTTNSTAWVLVTVPLTGGTIASGTGVTLSAVTGYTIASSANLVRPNTDPATFAWWYDDLEATGSASALVSTTRGELLLIPNVVGSARTPVSIAATGTINALLLHRPPSDQDINAQLLTSVSIAASPSTPAASTVAAVNARYGGTYAALLGVSANGAAGTNTVSVTVTQLENGTSVATKTLTASYTSPQSTRLVQLQDSTGQDLVLPLRATPSDNTLTTYTFAFNHSAGADTYSDFMLLNTGGQTVIAHPPSAAAAVYVDEPVPPLEGNHVYASATDRTACYSIDDTSTVIGPFIFDAGVNNLVLAWADAAVPALAITDYPRWQDERVA